MPDARTTVADLLAARQEGDTAVFDCLIEVVYDRRRYLAHVSRCRRRPGSELNTTALVHDLHFKLADQQHG